MSFISEIFAYPLRWLYQLTGNYGIAIILFALLVKLILLPFQMKSKRSMMRTSSLTPRLKELEVKYANDKQKYQEEVARIYKEENVSPMSGCIWSLIPFPILLALYSVVRQPLTYIARLSAEQITTVTDKLISLGQYITPEKADYYEQLTIANLIHDNYEAVSSALPGLMDMDFSFLGLNLGLRPQWNFFMNTDWSDVSIWLPALGLFLIPLISGALSFLQMRLSTKMSPQTAETAGSMKTMNMIMPLMSVYIAFIVPGLLGIYWIAQSLFGIIQDLFMNKYYGKKLEAENAERMEAFRLREEELERKRAETERLRIEGKTQVNKSTSKKRLHSLEKTKEEERLAAEKKARREAEGYVAPASQVGTRRYARGRAYVEDRFTNPETAEELTALAAEESELGDAIDTAAVISAEEAELEAKLTGAQSADTESAETDGPEEAAETDESAETENSEVESDEAE